MPVAQYILRYVELFGALASLYWWTKGGGSEAVIFFVVSLATFIGQDIFWSLRVDQAKRTRERDKTLFDELQQLINSDTLNFMKQHDHGESFSDSQIRGITTFSDTWDRVDKEFIDPKLERLRKRFHESVKAYVGLMGQHTFSDHYGTRRLNDHLQYQDEAKWEALRIEINSLADKATKALEELIREAKKKL